MKPLDRISVDPKICMGQPIIRGLRLTVALVLKLMASGMSQAEILAAYPELEAEDLQQVLAYAAGLAAESVYN